MWKNGPPQHPEFAVASGICTFLILLPITSHLKAGNVATLSMIAWLFVMNLTRFVNALVWANNVDMIIPVWCDITTKLTVGATIALPAAAMCICRYLEAVASVRWARQTETQKRHRRYFELFMCFGLPVLFMGIYYISQGHRFDIMEHIGCQPAVVITWVAFLTLYTPPLILSLIAFVYAALAIRHFYRRRVDFKRHLSASNAGISSGRYMRLMLLALTEMIFDTSVNCYIIWVNVADAAVRPYESWESIHFHFSRVQQVPTLLMSPFAWRVQQVVWWIIPIATVAFWSFFAFGQESIAEYKSWWNWIQRKVLRRKGVYPLGSSQGSSTRVGTRPNQYKSDSNSSANSSSNTKGPRIHIPFPSARKGNNQKLGDDDSFMSADDVSEKKQQPLSPISPNGIATTPQAAHQPLSYLETELDTSMFDTISHISVGEAMNDPDSPQHGVQNHYYNQPSATLGPYEPYMHNDGNRSATFASTGVRVGTPDTHTNGVRVEVATDVV